MISAQVLSIIAFLVSWLWWVTFIIGLIALVLIQTVWCCRQARSGLYISAGFAAAAGLASFISGIVIFFLWKDKSSCAVFNLTQFDDDDIYNENNGDAFSYDNDKIDNCNEWVFVQIALVETLLWLATSICIVHFVKSKRYKKQEERLCIEHNLTPPTPEYRENFNWVLNRNVDTAESDCEEQSVPDADDDNDDVIAVPDDDVPMASLSISQEPSTELKLTDNNDVETGPVFDKDTPMQPFPPSEIPILRTSDEPSISIEPSKYPSNSPSDSPSEQPSKSTAQRQVPSSDSLSDSPSKQPSSSSNPNEVPSETPLNNNATKISFSDEKDEIDILMDIPTEKETEKKTVSLVNFMFVEPK